MSYQPILFWKPPKGYLYPSGGRYLVYDSFTRANGAIGTTETVAPNGQPVPPLAWSGATWAVSGSCAMNTPATFSGETFPLGTMEVDSGWVNIGTPTTNERSTEQVHGGTYSRKIVTDAASEGAYNVATGTHASVWAVLSGWFYISTGTARLNDSSGYTLPATNATPITTLNSWIQQFMICRLTTIGRMPGIRAGAGATINIYYGDDLSLKELTSSELFATVSTLSANVSVGVNITQADAYNCVPCGIISRLDSTSNPQNFLLAYYDRSVGKVYLDKCVGGTYTVLINSFAPYLAGAALNLVAKGSQVSLYYNKIKVGATQTVSDTGIISNKIHGIFSPYISNTLDNFYVKSV